MGCFATEENTEDDNPPIGINYSRRRFKMKSVTRYFRNAVAASMQGTVNYKKERFFVVTEGELLSGKLSEENNFNIWKKEYDAESDNDEEKLKIKADYKTNLNYKSSGWFFLCNLYKNGKTRKRCKRMNDSAFLNSRRTGIFKDMSNGTICIPKDLRDNNGLEKNDRVELIPMQEGIYIRKAYGEKKCQ